MTPPVSLYLYNLLLLEFLLIFIVYKNPTPDTTGNLTVHGQGPSNWLAGLDIDSFQGATIGERVARAAASIKADILSPVGSAAVSIISSIILIFLFSPGFDNVIDADENSTLLP